MQAARGEDESLRKLSSYVARQVFGFNDTNPTGVGAARSLSLNVLKEVARRNALTVASWQAHGWMHGVMNTDNIAVDGRTIDFGPYAVRYSPFRFFSSSDADYLLFPLRSSWMSSTLDTSATIATTSGATLSLYVPSSSPLLFLG
jgi:uncharacterized protein YdiU (UPF0061 family)